MMITFHNQENTFCLKNNQISYIFSVEKERYILSNYFGKCLIDYQGSRKHYQYGRAFSSTPDSGDSSFSLDTALQEFPDAYQGDFRSPAYKVRSLDGDRVSRFEYKGYEIRKGKSALPGLPSIRETEGIDSETLEIYLEDEVRKLQLTLTYSIFEGFSTITRSVRLKNDSKNPIYLNKLMSISLDFLDGDWEVVTLHGSHLNEKNCNRRRLDSDLIKIESSRGTSSPQASPFIGLVKPDTREGSGEAIGFTLIYSGSFEGIVQKEQYGTLRVQLGINSEEFDWRLEPEQEFYSPEAVLAYSDTGLNGLSNQFHKLFSTCLVPEEFKEKERPVLINSWEAYYFDINEEKILTLAKESKQLGFDLLVVDDGWFHKRNSDTTSLGDWFVDRKKFPRGLSSLAEKVRNLGLELGIWFEPEMVSPDSDLYRKHPEWAIRSKRYDPILSRTQLVLDLANPDVCQYLVEAISTVVEETQISYIKWDMNRHLTDLYSSYLPTERQGELSHRYVLGLYSILESLRKRYPNLLFENCSSGGGRNDAGMLYYMPQTWVSDNSDAISRLSIQTGTSMFLPPATFGNHVSASPNHQVARVTPLETRFHVAAMGNLGYELDILALTDEEKEAIKDQIAFYKKYRYIFQFGHFHRLNEKGDKRVTWQISAPDKSVIIVMTVQILSPNTYLVPIIKLEELEKDREYKCLGINQHFYGDELMYAGISLPAESGDFLSQMLIFEAVEKK
ncbi:TPA: alpha-galactosidase [Streptococcus suis]|nr:alpha-galactosidase [Streptococcus suis]